MPDLNLPDDLIAFLQENKQLEYDPANCEAGAVTLRPLEALKVQLFPMDCQSTSVASKDPHEGEGGCYQVEAVDLVESCTGDYDPEGLLLWLPRERQFGTWDSSHTVIQVFGKAVTWSRILQKPAQHLNSQWNGAFPDSVPSKPLTPWRYHTYNKEQVFEVLPLLSEWYEAKWTRRGAYSDGVQVRPALEIRLRLEIGDEQCKVTAKSSVMDENDEYQTQATASKVLSADEWEEQKSDLEVNFWGQPERGAPSGGETLTMWTVEGYREKKSRKLFRTYTAGKDAGDPVHELGCRLAERLGEEFLTIAG